MLIRAHQDYSEDWVNLRFRTESGAVIKPIQMETEQIQEGDYMEPSMRLSWDEAQQLTNELHRVGFRPNGGEGTIAQVEAMKLHLADMRRLVFETK